MATTGTIKWTGYSTSESSVKLSYPYGSKELQMDGAVG